MAGELREIILPDLLPLLSVGDDNSVRKSVESPSYVYIKTKRIYEKTNENKNIIFECKLGTNASILGFSSSFIQHATLAVIDSISWRHPFSAVNFGYFNAKTVRYYAGINIYGGHSINFMGGYNTVDYYHHFIVNPTNKTISIYNPITNVQTHQLTLDPNIFTNSIVVFLHIENSTTLTHILNPNVESFKYQPTSAYDTDLYQAVLASPQGDIIVPKNNILSIL